MDQILSTLGEELKTKGIMAIGISLGLVIIFMLVYYRFCGIVACSSRCNTPSWEPRSSILRSSRTRRGTDWGSDGVRLAWESTTVRSAANGASRVSLRPRAPRQRSPRAESTRG